MTALLSLALAGAALAAPAVPADDALDDKVVERLDEYDDAYNEWRAESRRISQMELAAGEERPAMPPNPAKDFWPDFDGFAAAGSARAQVWCLQHYMAEGDEQARRTDFTRRAFSVFADADADLSAMPRALYGASRGPLDKEGARALLVMLQEVCQDAELDAEAAYMRIMVIRERDASAELEARMMDEYRALAKAYPETKYGRRADGMVFKADNLQIGMVAPDIVGADVDGNPMKLSDFRGKVTVIDFWGFW
ncbi:MAG: hypothetical protein AAGB93_06500 [Planctomycetota bacterium]